MSAAIVLRLGTVVEAILAGEVIRDVMGLILRGIGQMFGPDLMPELPYSTTPGVRANMGAGVH